MPYKNYEIWVTDFYDVEEADYKNYLRFTIFSLLENRREDKNLSLQQCNYHLFLKEKNCYNQIRLFYDEILLPGIQLIFQGWGFWKKERISEEFFSSQRNIFSTSPTLSIKTPPKVSAKTLLIQPLIDLLTFLINVCQSKLKALLGKMAELSRSFLETNSIRGRMKRFFSILSVEAVCLSPGFTVDQLMKSN